MEARLVIVCGMPGSGKTTEARALGAAVELHSRSAPLFARVQKRGMEDLAIRWETVQEWGAIFEPPTEEEMALFDAP